MKSLPLPLLTSKFLQQSGLQIDNSFSTAWKQLRFASMLTSCGFSKRTGVAATDVVFLLMLWVWLKADTISMFARESLLSFSSAKKDVLYDLLNREDLNWRKLQLCTAKKLIRQEGKSKIRAFVVDDSVKVRRGKKMPGVSSHFDHLTGRCVMGQQVLTLGYASDSQFVPLDNELFYQSNQGAAAHQQIQRRTFHCGKALQTIHGSN